MYINRTDIDAVVSACHTSRERATNAQETASDDTSDSYVSLAEAASVARSAASVTADPIYREALVNELAQRVSTGEYYIPTEQIVAKLLGQLDVGEAGT